jgi:hypothetical protein
VPYLDGVGYAASCTGANLGTSRGFRQGAMLCGRVGVSCSVVWQGGGILFCCVAGWGYPVLLCGRVGVSCSVVFGDRGTQGTRVPCVPLKRDFKGSRYRVGVGRLVLRCSSPSRGWCGMGHGWWVVDVGTRHATCTAVHAALLRYTAYCCTVVPMRYAGLVMAM